MILVDIAKRIGRSGIPRESGDDPWPVGLVLPRDLYSPRERG